MSTEWTAHQLISFPIARLGAELPTRRGFNPRPRGVLCVGSTTDAVYQFLLRAHAERRWRCHQIVTAVARSPKTVSWSLVYLQAIGLIEATPDGGNVRYLKYRVVARKDGRTG